MRKNLPLRILIADDHSSVREGLAALLSRQEDMCVVAEAANGQEAIDLYRLHRPGIVLMDGRMPHVTGPEAIRAICREFPAAYILLITALANDAEIALALQFGAKGWLFKDAPIRELLAAVRMAATPVET